MVYLSENVSILVQRFAMAFLVGTIKVVVSFSCFGFLVIVRPEFRSLDRYIFGSHVRKRLFINLSG